MLHSDAKKAGATLETPSHTPENSITDEHNSLLLLRNKSENGVSQVCTQLSLLTSNCHPAAHYSLGVQLLVAPEFC